MEYRKNIISTSLPLTRRRFIMASGASMVSSLILPNFGRATLASEKTLKLYNSNTGEWFKGVYEINGTYIQENLKEINHFLRDFRTGEIKKIDLKLLDLIHQLALKVDEKAPFEVISGYRSPKTNAQLRKKGKGVAKASYHLKGQAIDLRGSRSLRHLRDAARSLKAGGVGYYPSSHFIHLDTRGKVKWW